MSRLAPDGFYSTGAAPLWDESDRLAALRDYDILDSPATEEFDDFVRIAAEVCDAPIAVVNLIDEGRQWFAAELGLGVRQTALDVSICSHAILQPGVFVVPDLTQDRRFCANPLVSGHPGLRFYGGALLETAEGLPLGTLCVLDYTPRPGGLTDRQLAILQALARQVMTQLELRRALRQRTQAWEATDTVTRELQALVAEKDLLMQEAHHRVTNSLATVHALLLLQARQTRQDEVAHQLREAAVRVHTFGAMHQHLYRAGATAEVDIAAYLKSLVDNQETAFAVPLAGRSISFEATSSPWPSVEAATLGLIVVELVTNALKYGAGPVRITLRLANGEAVLTVEDAGLSLSPDFDPAHSKGLGMRIIAGLLHGSRQGRLEVDRSCDHTRFVVTLKLAAGAG